jgi:hypothetical protein
MSRILLLLTIVLLHPAMVQAQTVKGTFRNAVDATAVAAGTLSLYNMTTKVPVFGNEISGHEHFIFNNTDYRVSTDEDRLFYGNEWRKHHLWDDQLQEYRLSNEFSVPQGNPEVVKTAVFTDARKTTLFNNFEEFTDEGEVRFRDPWYYVNAEHEQPDALLPFPSPYVPTGAYDKSEPAVLLGKQVQPSKPFYSLKFHSFLQSNYKTPKAAPLTGDDWVFIGAHARDAGGRGMYVAHKSKWIDVPCNLC